MTYEETEVREPVLAVGGWDEEHLPANVSRLWMTRMLGLVRRLGASGDLGETLQHITDGVVDVLNFGAAALNVTLPDGDLRCDAVAGPPGLRDALLGTVGSWSAWQRMLPDCDRWGSLLFLPANRQPSEGVLPEWVPEIDETDDPDAWHPRDSLFAPLVDRDGALLGILSVDAPASGLHPDAQQRILLELFAAEAANALADALGRTRLRDREVVFRQVFAEAPVAMLIADGDLTVLHANDAFGALAGAPPVGLVGTTLAALAPGREVDGLVAACRHVAAGEAPSRSLEHRLIRVTDGQVRWVRATVSRIDTERAGPRLVLRAEDVTEERQALLALRRLADHDALTGLPNRRRARHRLDQLLAGGEHGTVAVLYCDLDGFKGVNDRLGHAAGDELLALVGSRLSRVVRPPDLLCRQGGDEFVVIANVGAGEDPGVIAQRCIDALAAPFALRGGPATVTLSVGVAVADQPGLTASELLREADAALYLAKAAGRNRWASAG